MYKCEKCQDEFYSIGGLKNHMKVCNGVKKYRKRKNVNHVCPKCNNYIKTCIEKHIKKCNGNGTRRMNYPKKFTKEQFSELAIKRWKNTDYRKKVIEILKSTDCRTKSVEKETERRKKLSEHAKKNNYGGYKKGSGRGKCGWYKGYWCDSSWELAWIIYNLDHNIKFERNYDKFEYFFNDKKLNYIPDFKIDDNYIEIKGYYTKQFEEKVKQFSKNLKIYGKNEMIPFLKYSIDNYGKNFIDLYDK